MIYREILRWAVGQMTLGRHSIHGPCHWMQVWRNGRRIAKATPGADPCVVALFALFHDCRRVREGRDPDHGRRAADAIGQIRLTLLSDLEERQFDLLLHALVSHNDGQVSDDPTIGACWDADRLDLPRVGIRVSPALLSTAAARVIVQSGSRGPAVRLSRSPAPRPGPAR